jgi:hypothetical protein
MVIIKYDRNKRGIPAPEGAQVQPEHSKRKPHVVIDDGEYKHCSQCGKWQPLAQYSIKNETWDHMQHVCKTCFAELGKRRYY